MEFLDPQSLNNAVQEKIHRLRTLVADYESELPSATCSNFVKTIKLILLAVEEYHSEWMTHLATAWQSDPAFQADLKTSTSRIALRILRNIERELLPSLRASLLQSPYLVKQMIERVVTSLVPAKEVELTLTPTFDYVYGFTGMLELATSQIEKLGGFGNKQEHLDKASELPKWTVFLSFPLVEHESALNQVVLAHELAHFIVLLQDLQAKLRPFTLDQASFSALVQEVNGSPLRYFATPLTTLEEVEQHCYQVCSAMVESWMLEVMADLIAVHSLGPAYFLSFVEFLAHSSVDDVPDRTHPAPSYRCEWVLQELLYLEYSLVPTAIGNTLWSLQKTIGESARRATNSYSGPELVAHRTIETKFEDILGAARTLCTTFSYSAQKYKEDVPPLVAQLSKGLVPMNQYHEGKALEALSPVPVLNAGMEVRTIRWNEFESLFVADSKVGRIDRLQTLNGLIFKSVELNEVVRAFHS